MIIVEGMDSTGKTTLVRRLSSDLQLLVINNRRKPQSALEIIRYQKMVLKMDKYFPVILDRLATISEPIYGPICRGTDLLRGKQALLLLQLRFVNPVIIYCRPSKHTIFEFQEPQMDGVITHREELLYHYDLDMALIGESLRVYHYDWENDDYQDLLNYLKERM